MAAVLSAANCAVVKPWAICVVVSASDWPPVSAAAWAVVSPWRICAVVSAAALAADKTAMSWVSMAAIWAVDNPCATC